MKSIIVYAHEKHSLTEWDSKEWLSLFFSQYKVPRAHSISYRIILFIFL